ncbi:cell division protein ZapE [Ruixingdingia sedimenti]|uniref:Cell division protein ZapE n=1 Tax=Ruixingdingia sedimenti TaxID=3073604 RepID=A0ABU1F9M7_9RHOB|nr:cell division protein ZapE [Xinfangfangia sp. LG-4]MDR5653584.1 cell division protein ZapE [Xinfangfangia sp. LG-4]
MRQSLTEIYDNRAAEGSLRPDPAQRAVLPLLEDIRTRLETAPPPRSRGLLGGLLRRGAPEPAGKGLYLWGGVGRGKSMLMDLFTAETAITAKRRVHFHAFMQEIQRELHAARQRGAADALVPVADAVAQDLRLLCFDEMQITDIADAMVVGRLFERLMAQGVTIVTTSNRPPDDLYKNGLNRGLFLPFIGLIKERMTVAELESPTDYRQHRLAGTQVYFTPADPAAHAALSALWDELTGGGAGAPLTLAVNGREITLDHAQNGVARASFWDLCARPLGPGDYLAIAAAVRVLIVEDIPRLSAANYNEAKRFVTLVDALYEAKVRLIASAADEPERLYAEGTGAFEFERTASRLREMQGADWGAAAD